MPLYEYQCGNCAFLFELKQSFNDKPVAECPRCQGEARRIISPVPILFKGSGFYITDNRKHNGSSPKYSMEDAMADAGQPSDKPPEHDTKQDVSES